MDKTIDYISSILGKRLTAYCFRLDSTAKLKTFDDRLRVQQLADLIDILTDTDSPEIIRALFIGTMNDGRAPARAFHDGDYENIRLHLISYLNDGYQ